MGITANIDELCNGYNNKVILIAITKVTVFSEMSSCMVWIRPLEHPEEYRYRNGRKICNISTMLTL